MVLMNLHFIRLINVFITQAFLISVAQQIHCTLYLVCTAHGEGINIIEERAIANISPNMKVLCRRCVRYRGEDVMEIREHINSLE